jgi:hypothetical protein
MMTKAFVAMSLALAGLSLAAFGPAQAGGATSAPSKYNQAFHVSHTHQSQSRTQSASVTIEEFSSSSAKASVSKR